MIEPKYKSALKVLGWGALTALSFFLFYVHFIFVIPYFISAIFLVDKLGEFYWLWTSDGKS